MGYLCEGKRHNCTVTAMRYWREWQTMKTTLMLFLKPDQFSDSMYHWRYILGFYVHISSIKKAISELVYLCLLFCIRRWFSELVLWYQRFLRACALSHQDINFLMLSSLCDPKVFGVCVCVCVGLHSTRLPLCATELGIRKSHPYLYTSRESRAIPTHQLC